MSAPQRGGSSAYRRTALTASPTVQAEVPAPGADHQLRATGSWPTGSVAGRGAPLPGLAESASSRPGRRSARRVIAFEPDGAQL